MKQQETKQQGNNVEPDFTSVLGNVWITDTLARAIGVFELPNKNQYEIFDSLSYAFDFPLFIALAKDLGSEYKANGESKLTIFDTLDINEELLLSSFDVYNDDGIISSTLVNDYSDFVGFDINKKIDLFVPSSFSKAKKFFLNKYSKKKHLLINLSRESKIPMPRIVWLLKKLFSPESNIWTYEPKGSKFVLKCQAPGSKKMVEILNKTLEQEYTKVFEHHKYYESIYQKIHNECLSILEYKPTKNKNGVIVIDPLIKHKKQIIVAYYKMLAIKVYEYFERIKYTTQANTDLNKFAMLLIQIETEIRKIEAHE